MLRVEGALIVWVLWTGLSWAEEPLPSVTALLEAARQGMHAPPGCHKMKLDIDHHMAVGPWAYDEKYVATAIMDQGVWSDFDWKLVSTNQPGLQLRFSDPHWGKAFPFFPPSFGLFHDRAEDTLGSYQMMDRLLQDYEPADEVSVLLDDVIGRRPAWRVQRTLTLKHESLTRRLDLDVRLDASTKQPRSWRAELRKGVPLPDGPGRAKRLLIQLEADHQGIPLQEQVTGLLVLSVFPIDVDQKITYTALSRCESKQAEGAAREKVRSVMDSEP
jgi:hypothetical protein